MLDLAKELKKEGCGTIIVTHNLQHIFSIVDRITVLRYDGQMGEEKIEEAGTDEIEQLSAEIGRNEDASPCTKLCPTK